MQTIPLEDFTLQIAFARAKLGDLKDSSGTLIFDHALRVFLLLAETFAACDRAIDSEESEMLSAALFHDLLEDTDASREEIIRHSSQNTLRYVEELTITFEGKTIPAAVQSVQEISEPAFLVKLADIHDNCTKSRFLAREGGENFFLGFFQPLIEEYQRIVTMRLGGCASYKAEAERLARGIDESAERMRAVVHCLWKN
jgi:hypothetical protein